MRNSSRIRVIDAERFRGGLIVTFQNNRGAYFSGAALYDAISHAHELTPSDSDTKVDEDHSMTEVDLQGFLGSPSEFMKEASIPLETLMNLVFLAKEDASRPEKVQFYMAEAERQLCTLRTVCCR